MDPRMASQLKRPINGKPIIKVYTLPCFSIKCFVRFEQTSLNMFIYLSKKIAIPNNAKLNCVSWNPEQGWIACGGEDGMLKVLRMDAVNAEQLPLGQRGIAAPTSLSMNQTLDGHSNNVMCVAWNGVYRKLTTSDRNGLIIVWSYKKGTWVEEMINNREKSVVKDMKWTPDGQKICIIYEDGAVIVGSVDGNRLWGKDLAHELAYVEWAPDGKFIAFVTMENEVYLYDNAGTKITDLTLYAVDQGDQANALIAGIHWYNGLEGYSSEDAPTMALAFRCGKVQISRNQVDDEPVLIDTGMMLKQCKWNSNGTVLALAGTQTVRNSNGKAMEINVIQFYDPFGTHLKSLKVPGTKIEAFAWEGGGLRLCLAVDSHLYFANVRPQYIWGYFCNTLVYSYNKPDFVDTCVTFWDTGSDERYTKYIKGLLSIQAADDNCVLATLNPDSDGEYLLILCDTIGSPVDSKVMPIYPKYVTMTKYHVIAASDTEVYTWQYRTPVSKLTSIAAESKSAFRRKDGRERIFHIEDSVDTPPCDASKYQSMKHIEVDDPITCVCASEHYLFVARASGTLNRYTLPHISLEERYLLRCRPQRIALNCDTTKMSIIDINNMFSLFDFEVINSEAGKSTRQRATLKGEHLEFEKKDTWDMVWADDNPELFAITEKTRMHVFRNLESEKPIVTCGYLCKYSALQVKVALMDELMITPDQPEKEFVFDYETRSLRDAQELLNVGLQEAYEFIEANSHPRLWRLLADASLQELEFGMAERCFVKCADYKGIQYVKRVCSQNDKAKQKAEVAAYFLRFDEAESIYREIDRKDLAIELRMRLGDWFRVVQLVQSGTGDDNMLISAWNKIGEYYRDRQKWLKACQYFAQARNSKALVTCYYSLEDFHKLELLAESLDDSSPLLPDIAQKFQSVGLTTLASKMNLRIGNVRGAIDCCVLLNDWDTAVSLAEQHNFPQIEGLLAKYASHLLEQGKTLQAIELYRRANKSTEAASLLAKLAQDIGKSSNNPLRAKKFHVLAALEVERFRRKMLDVSTMGGMTAAQTTAATLDNLMQHDKATGENKSLDNAWRGAEAYHLFLLAHRQLYFRRLEEALQTSLKLREYEDILAFKEIYSLVGIVSYYTKHYEQCSKAFIKLESNPTFTIAEKQQYADLALAIFLNTSPQDPPSSRNAPCKSCQKPMKPGATTCSSCYRTYTICMMTGATIIDERVYTCKTCRHHSIESELRGMQSCPLCHAPLS